MGHLSVAAHDYLLTGERGRWAAGRGEERVGAGNLSRRPSDLWQVSATCFPDRSSGLEFIWVTATSVVCCEKRLMGRAPGSLLGSSVWRGTWPRELPAGHGVAWVGAETGCTPLPLPMAAPH